MLFLRSSLCLLAPSFVPALFLRSPITIYLSFFLSFARVSPPSFCRSHALIMRSVAPSIRRLDLLSSVLHSPPLISSIVLLSSALQSTVLGQGATAVQLILLLLITVMRLALFLPLSSIAASGHIAVVPSLSLCSVHPSSSSFVHQRFGRSIRPSSGPEPIRYIHPSLSRSVSRRF